ncbi:Fungalysin metallopeptidase-domain-containing protein [Daedaleopsis nitida]|nr:Fungalysin metallopeptidase-domain-containing protein [Daedaleopsis nitida]
MLALIFLAMLCATLRVNATPGASVAHYVAIRTRGASANRTIGSHHSPSTYEVSTVCDENAAAAFARSRRIDLDGIDIGSSLDGGPARHVYLRKRANGVPFANAVANVALNRYGKVVAYGSSFVKASKLAPSTPTISVEDAIAARDRARWQVRPGQPSQLQYFVRDDGSVVLTHSVYIHTIAAGTGVLVFVTDFVAHASRALPAWKQTPDEGIETPLVDPQDTKSSPQGWHSDPTTSTNITAGNNAPSSPGLVFDYPAELDTDPTVTENLNAARVSAFYIVNTRHPLQDNNFGKGGDRVQIIVQSNLGVNNAGLVTMPDGMPGFLHFAFENDIVIHETVRGLTNRMTGGGTASCLQATESRGMGEGWSDAFAEYTLTEEHLIGEFWANLLPNVYAALVETSGYSPSARTDPSGTAGNAWCSCICSWTRSRCSRATRRSRTRATRGSRRTGTAMAGRIGTPWTAFATRGLRMDAADYNDDSTVPDDC